MVIAFVIVWILLFIAIMLVMLLQKGNPEFLFSLISSGLISMVTITPILWFAIAACFFLGVLSLIGYYKGLFAKKETKVIFTV